MLSNSSKFHIKMKDNTGKKIIFWYSGLKNHIPKFFLKKDFILQKERLIRKWPQPLNYGSCFPYFIFTLASCSSACKNPPKCGWLRTRTHGDKNKQHTCLWEQLCTSRPVSRSGFCQIWPKNGEVSRLPTSNEAN